MKVAITGHTKGIGKALYEKFKSQGHSVIGFSFSTGFDIGDPERRKEIIDWAFDCDVFINNAYHPTGQTELLKKFIHMWGDTDKLIINVSSKFVFQKQEIARFKEYIDVKKEQNQIIESRMDVNHPRILNILPGVVDTQMASMFDTRKLDPDQIADLVLDLLKYKDAITVQQLILDIPTVDWSDIKLKA